MWPAVYSLRVGEQRATQPGGPHTGAGVCSEPPRFDSRLKGRGAPEPLGGGKTGLGSPGAAHGTPFFLLCQQSP